MSREIWKVIPNFSKYEASSQGRVRSSAKRWTGGKRILSPANNGNDYLFVKLVNDQDKTKKVYVHEAVLLAFAGERPVGNQAAHLNAKRVDNRATNLTWKTREENNLDDKVTAGTAHPDSKVLLIQSLLGAGVTQKEAAEKAQVSLSTVRDVAVGNRKPVFLKDQPGNIYDEIGKILAAS